MNKTYQSLAILVLILIIILIPNVSVAQENPESTTTPIVSEINENSSNESEIVTDTATQNTEKVPSIITSINAEIVPDYGGSVKVSWTSNDSSEITIRTPCTLGTYAVDASTKNKIKCGSDGQAYFYPANSHIFLQFVSNVSSPDAREWIYANIVKDGEAVQEGSNKVITRIQDALYHPIIDIPISPREGVIINEVEDTPKRTSSHSSSGKKSRKVEVQQQVNTEVALQQQPVAQILEKDKASVKVNPVVVKDNTKTLKNEISKKSVDVLPKVEIESNQTAAVVNVPKISKIKLFFDWLFGL